MGQQMVMSLNEDLPCGFWAADDFQSCFCRPQSFQTQKACAFFVHLQKAIFDETSIDSRIAHAIFD